MPALRARCKHSCTVEREQFTLAAISRCLSPSACSLNTSRIFTMGNLS